MWRLYIKKNNEWAEVEYDISTFVFNVSKYSDSNILDNYSAFSFSFDIPMSGNNNDVFGLYLNAMPDKNALVEGVPALLYNNNFPIEGLLMVTSIENDTYKANFKSYQSTIKADLEKWTFEKLYPLGYVHIPLNMNEFPYQQEVGEFVVYPQNAYVNFANKTSYLEEDTTTGLNSVFKYIEPLFNVKELLERCFKIVGYDIKFDGGLEDTLTSQYIAPCDHKANSITIKEYGTPTKTITSASPKQYSFGVDTYRTIYATSMARIVESSLYPTKLDNVGFRVKFKTYKENGVEKIDLIDNITSTDAYPAICFHFWANESEWLFSSGGVYRKFPADTLWTNVWKNQDEKVLREFWDAAMKVLEDNTFSQWTETNDGLHEIELLFHLSGYIYASNKFNAYDLIYQPETGDFDDVFSDTYKMSGSSIELYTNSNANRSFSQFGIFLTINPKYGYTGGSYINVGKSLGLENLYEVVEVICQINGCFFNRAGENIVEIYSKKPNDNIINITPQIDSVDFEKVNFGGLTYKEDEYLKGANPNTYKPLSIIVNEDIEPNEINAYNITNATNTIPYANVDGEIRNLTGFTVVSIEEVRGDIALMPTQINYLEQYGKLIDIQTSQLKLKTTISSDEVHGDIIGSKFYLTQFGRWFYITEAQYKYNLIELEAIAI